jgi:CBS domain-containing protein
MDTTNGMRAKDIMTRAVVTITPETTIREIAAILLERRFSGLPVVADGRVVAIVSEGDLLRRHEIGSDRPAPRGSWWMRLFHGDGAPAEYVRSHAVHAADVMTRDVASVAEDESIGAVAALLCQRRIKRVPVLGEGKLVGIVTRADLVRAFAAGPDTAHGPPLDDDAIRARLLLELGTQSWWRSDSNVLVTDGVVRFFGVVENELEKQAARVAAENIPGVRRVDDDRVRYLDLPYSMG